MGGIGLANPVRALSQEQDLESRILDAVSSCGDHAGVGQVTKERADLDSASGLVLQRSGQCTPDAAGVGEGIGATVYDG